MLNVRQATGMYTNSWDPNNGQILISTDQGKIFTPSTLPFKVGGNMPGRGMGEVGRLHIYMEGIADEDTTTPRSASLSTRTATTFYTSVLEVAMVCGSPPTSARHGRRSRTFLALVSCCNGIFV